jgi:hypothetical protein
MSPIINGEHAICGAGQSSQEAPFLGPIACLDHVEAATINIKPAFPKLPANPMSGEHRRADAIDPRRMLPPANVRPLLQNLASQ